jgi:hypothetical protein
VGDRRGDPVHRVGGFLSRSARRPVPETRKSGGEMIERISLVLAGDRRQGFASPQFGHDDEIHGPETGSRIENMQSGLEA